MRKWQYEDNCAAIPSQPPYLLIQYKPNILTVYIHRFIEDQGSILGRIIPKTLKIVLDTSLLNTQQYKVRIKGKVEQSGERSSALPYISV